MVGRIMATFWERYFQLLESDSATESTPGDRMGRSPPPEPVKPKRKPASRRAASTIPQKWVHETTDDDRYVGRDDALDRLNAWAIDPNVRAISVTGLGGLGKTALVGYWLKRSHGLQQRRFQGLFFWSFYVNRSVNDLFTALQTWGRRFGVR